MEPTTTEVVFWIVVGVACLVFFGLCWLSDDTPHKKDNIEILRIKGK